MIHGFSARMLERYLVTTNDAMNMAVEVNNRNPFAEIERQREAQRQLEEEQRQNRLIWCRQSEAYIDPWGNMEVNIRQPVPFPQLARPVNHRLPFTPENAFGGRHSLGMGNSSNIVVDEGLYEDTLRKLDMVDDECGENIHKTSMIIEEMCSSMYVVPETGPRVKAIADRVKSMLGEFRSLTENTSIQTRKFVNEIRHIDQADHMFTFALEERSAAQVVSGVRNSMGQQAQSMKNTANGYSLASRDLRSKANTARNQAQQFRQTIQQLRGQLNGIQSRFVMGPTSGFSANQDMRDFYRQMRELERQMRDAERQMMTNSFRR